MSNFDNTIGQNGKNNTQTNNITNNYNPTNNGSFSSLLGSDIVFDHNALKEIIILVHKKIGENNHSLEIDRSSIDIDKKNTINNHSKSYFTNVVEKDFYPCFSQLENFIRLKENKELQEKLESIIKDLNRRILAFQEDNIETKFEKILLDISQNIISKNYTLMKSKERQILLLLYYFYTNCLTGKKK